MKNSISHDVAILALEPDAMLIQLVYIVVFSPDNVSLGFDTDKCWRPSKVESLQLANLLLEEDGILISSFCGPT